jgi:hypothetical protein
MRSLRTAILAVAGGLLLAFAVNMLTLDQSMFKTLGGPIVAVTQQGSIDYWTGEITPMILIIGDARPGGVQTEFAIPHDYRTRRAIPLPVAFAGGSLLTLGVITLARRRKGTPAPAASLV